MHESKTKIIVKKKKISVIIISLITISLFHNRVEVFLNFIVFYKLFFNVIVNLDLEILFSFPD